MFSYEIIKPIAETRTSRIYLIQSKESSDKYVLKQYKETLSELTESGVFLIELY